MTEEKKQEDLVIDDDPCAGENFKPVKAWLCVIAALMFFIVGTGSLNMLNPILKLMLTEWNLETTMGSNWNSILNIVCAVAAFPVGFIMNKYGFRVLGYVGYGVLICTAVAGALCPNEWVMMVIRALQGLGYVIPGLISVYCVTQWFPRDKQAFPITIVALGPNIARIAVTQMSKPAIALGGWRMQWWFYLGVCIVAFIFFIFFMKQGPGFAAAEAKRREKEAKKAAQEKAPLSVALKNPYVWAVTGIMLFFSLSSRGFDTFTNMILVENCGILNDTASDITSAYSFAKMAAAPLCGLVMARFLMHRGKIVACMLTVAFTGMVFGFLLNSLWMAWVFVIVVGCTCCAIPYSFAVLPQFCKDPAILAMALTFANFLGKYLAGFAAPYVVSTVQTMTGSFSMVAIPCGVFAACGIFCVWFVGLGLDKMTKREHAAKAALQA